MVHTGCEEQPEEVPRVLEVLPRGIVPPLMPAVLVAVVVAIVVVFIGVVVQQTRQTKAPAGDRYYAVVVVQAAARLERGVRPPMPHEQLAATRFEWAQVGVCRVDDRGELRVKEGDVAGVVERVKIEARALDNHVLPQVVDERAEADPAELASSLESREET